MAEQKYDFYAVLFSILDGALSQAEEDALAKVTATYRILNHRLGRFLVDICGPKNQLIKIRDGLIAFGRDPKILGVWDADNVLVMRGSAADWIAVAEDVITYDADGNVLSVARPTAFRSTHEWMGWAPRTDS